MVDFSLPWRIIAASEQKCRPNFKFEPREFSNAFLLRVNTNVYISLQHFVLTKNNQLQAEQAGDSLCVEAVGTSLVLVSCDDGPKQWSVVEVR